MARYTGPACKLCRREGIKLFLKGERCYSAKCALDRRGYAPGQHGQRRGKPTEYGIQLREKQKERRMHNAVYRKGLAPSRASSRQLVLHGHLTLDGKKVNIPSLLVKPGQVLAVTEASRDRGGIKENLKSQEKRNFPAWVEMDVEKLRGTFKALPGKDDIAL